MTHRVVITGVGAYSPIGNDWSEVESNLRARESGVRHIEAWEEYYHDDARTKKGMATDNGACLRAGIFAGIVTGASVEDVDEMKPFEVNDMAGKVAALIIEANRPPKKKTS